VQAAVAVGFDEDEAVEGGVRDGGGGEVLVDGVLGVEGVRGWTPG